MQEKWKFDYETLVKIGKGALISGGAVAIIYFLEGVAKMDFNSATPLVVGIAGILINLIKEWRKGE